ncbi:hypothetical protein CTAM01_02043 [Colletotrichum tamarilloi]|uniref:Uncharacterized protein n=1 Tax=Colletotrichum tamarilloi TaxID=1209934 RepID=A0ABQ9RQE4_9PEZI|nr:uncharacterized protein CTAM01_02043 [Colletotrichum tamarilloi]KAK1509920.1 hypothetical protein CTAM01_02043 [Colletotrichum tamarilloi]
MPLQCIKEKGTPQTNFVLSAPIRPPSDGASDPSLSLSSLMQCALLLLFLRHRCADQRPSPQSLTLTGTIAIIITTKLGLGPRLLIPDLVRLVQCLRSYPVTRHRHWSSSGIVIVNSLPSPVHPVRSSPLSPLSLSSFEAVP